MKSLLKTSLQIAAVRLRDKSSLTLFKNSFEEAAQASVSMEYLDQARVYGYYREGELRGGFVVNSMAPLRYKQWAPSIDAVELTKQALEFACLWAVQKEKRAVTDRYFLMALGTIKAHKVALIENRSFVIAGTLYPKLASTQRRVFNIPIYKGAYDPDRAKSCEIYASHVSNYGSRLTQAVCNEAILRSRRSR